jgi:hypothetical protein
MTTNACWELTPSQLFACFAFVKSGVTVPMEVKPFTSPHQPLEGTPYTYQIGLAAAPRMQYLQTMKSTALTAPLSGDNRSGVLILNGKQVIASCIVPGVYTTDPYSLVVDASYRRQGLATRMVEMWLRTMRHNDAIPMQHINANAARTFLKAHANVVTWAKAQGKQVPPEVILAIARGGEAAEILRRAAQVEQAP